VLEVKRSSPIAAEAGVPQLYRFHLGPGDGPDVPITWEIPELGEIVQGRTKDSPMPIVRAKPTPGLTLAVRREGPTVLLYSVFKNGTLEGGDQLLLVDNGTAWIGLTWPEDRQDPAAQLTHVQKMPSKIVGKPKTNVKFLNQMKLLKSCRITVYEGREVGSFALLAKDGAQGKKAPDHGPFPQPI